MTKKMKKDIIDRTMNAAVKRSLIELEKDFGKVIPIQEIVNLNMEYSEEEIISVIEEMKSEGLVTEVDKDTIELNYDI